MIGKDERAEPANPCKPTDKACSAARQDSPAERTSPGCNPGRFVFRKLVRDVVPERVRKLWRGYCEYRVMEHAEYLDALRAKLHEEVEECLEEDGSLEEVAAEFADVYEVLEALAAARGVSGELIAGIKKKKKLDRGGYEKRYWVEWVELEPDTELYRYCIARPKKYPKV